MKSAAVAVLYRAARPILDLPVTMAIIQRVVYLIPVVPFRMGRSDLATTARLSPRDHSEPIS